MKQLFELRDVGVRYGETDVLRSINLCFAPGEFAAIAGPNGAGKSTLLFLLAALKAPSVGVCLFHGQAAHLWNRLSFARQVAVVLSTNSSAFPFTVEDIVYMGRMPHRSGLIESPEDNKAVERALELTEAVAFRHREFRTLSSGEKQRVLLASALAQEPQALLLDEPSAHLDLRHQIALYKLLHQLSQEGMLVIAVTHDLNVAGLQADRLILLGNGKVQADGPPTQVMQPEIVSNVFQVPVEIHCTSSGQRWMSYGG